MTERNLNGNFIDTLSRQYKYDLKEDCPHPIRYLLKNPRKNRDLYYLVPTKIDEPTFRKSLVKYDIATRGTSIVDWENEHIKIFAHPRYIPGHPRYRPPTEADLAFDAAQLLLPNHQHRFSGSKGQPSSVPDQNQAPVAESSQSQSSQPPQ